MFLISNSRMTELFKKNNDELISFFQKLNDESNRKIQEISDESNRKIQEISDESNRKIQELSDESNRKIQEISDESNRKIQELNNETNKQKQEVCALLKVNQNLEEKIKYQEDIYKQRFNLVSEAINHINRYLEYGKPQNFRGLLEYYIALGNFNSFYDNYDMAFSDEEQINNWISHVENDFCSNIEWSLKQLSEEEKCELEKVFDLLEDDKSKDIFVRLIAWKLIGFTKVKLLSEDQIREEEAFISRKEEMLLDKQESIYDVKYKLNCFDLSILGFPIKCYAIPESIVMDFIRNQYENDYVKLEKEDYVIDCGACWGDTALLFASKVGLDGKIISFEFVPSNMKIFEENMKMNSEISSIVSLVNCAVSDKTGECIEYIDDGTATSIDIDKINLEGKIQKAYTITIDDYVEQENLHKVDFIKMDIEGAEMSALKGGMKTIKRFKPKLAISIYHKKSDMWEIPQWIKQVCPEYKLYIKHNSKSSLETILFAKV